MNHARVYAIIGSLGFIFSSLLIAGISRKMFMLFVPWICFQLINISYQVYFAFEVIKSNHYEISNQSSRYTSMIVLIVYIFHTIFECYYLCLIIGLSQIIANKSILEKSDIEMAPFQQSDPITILKSQLVLEGSILSVPMSSMGR